ncbi:serine/threonine protein kinase, partial [Cutibacterium acnes subsp. acnes]|nr:serine/threonine protein kinase [Cutibacterium acnes subsp. acnes]
LGSADAAADLERRIRFPVDQTSQAEKDPWWSDESSASVAPQDPDELERAEEYGPDEEGYWSPEAAAGEWGRRSGPLPWSGRNDPHITQLPPQDWPNDAEDEP